MPSKTARPAAPSNSDAMVCCESAAASSMSCCPDLLSPVSAYGQLLGCSLSAESYSAVEISRMEILICCQRKNISAFHKFTGHLGLALVIRPNWLKSFKVVIQTREERAAWPTPRVNRRY